MQGVMISDLGQNEHLARLATEIEIGICASDAYSPYLPSRFVRLTRKDYSRCFS
jgi:hypothetical protein